MDSSESGIWNLDVKKKFGRQKKSHEIGLGRGMKKIWTSKKNWSLESGRPKKNGVFGVWSLDVQKNLRRQKKNWGGAAPPPKTPLHAADKTRGGHFEEGRQNRTESISKF